MSLGLHRSPLSQAPKSGLVQTISRSVASAHPASDDFVLRQELDVACSRPGRQDDRLGLDVHGLAQLLQVHELFVLGLDLFSHASDLLELLVGVEGTPEG